MELDYSYGRNTVKEIIVDKNFSIVFNSAENFSLEDVVGFTLEDRKYFFKISRIHCTNADSAVFTAEQTGYWGSNLSKRSNLNIKKLLHTRLILADEQEKEKLKKQSRYC